MLGKSGDYAKTGKLIVTMAAVAVDPTGLAATGATLEAYLHYHESLISRHPALTKLTRELDRDLKTRLKTPDFHCPQEADTLLPQMLEAALPTGDDFVDCGLDADLILDRVVGKLSGPDHTKPDMITAFRALYGPVLHKACNDPRLEKALRPALTREQMRRQTKQDDLLKEALARLGGIEGALKNPETASLEDLNRVARQFGADDFTDKAPLIEFLTNKAEEYRAYRKQIDALDDRTAALSNLKAAAEDAAARLDFDEVEEVLSRVDEVETEIAAETKEARAANALLRGRVEDAYTVLSAAADSFASIGPLEPAKRRLHYEDQLYAHGLRYGGIGMALSEQMIRTALAAISHDSSPELWALAQNSLAIALQEQGIRTGGEAGTKLLADAVTAYRAALTVFTPEDYSVDWAMTKNNLGNALQEQGTRTGGDAGTKLLADAVTAYRAALTIRTRDDHPVDWAMTQNNLGIALQNQGIRTGGDTGTKLLADAVTAYRDALTIRTRDDHPVQWATTQNNLGAALRNQGTRTGGDTGTELLADAVTAYRDALTIYTPDDHPVQWAMTQNNLGIALQNQGIRTGGDTGTKLLADAVTAFRDALTIHTRDDHPVQWAMTQENLAICEEAFADHEVTSDPQPHLQSALEHVEAALNVYDPDHMPYDFGTATKLRDRINARLSR